MPNVISHQGITDKTTMCYHCTPVTMADVQQSDNSRYWWGYALSRHGSKTQCKATTVKPLEENLEENPHHLKVDKDFFHEM